MSLAIAQAISKPSSDRPSRNRHAAFFMMLFWLSLHVLAPFAQMESRKI
jgi:hypothetical protein